MVEPDLFDKKSIIKSLTNLRMFIIENYGCATLEKIKEITNFVFKISKNGNS